MLLRNLKPKDDKMNKELENKLYRKYPKIFRQKDLPPSETAMCWGICVGDGWYEIIDKLCEKLTKVDKDIEAVQVKEKFAGLRFYTTPTNSKAINLISKAEDESFSTCEFCGSKKNVKQVGKVWIKTLCNKCAKTYKK